MKYLKTNEEFNLRRTMGMAAIAAMPFMTSCDKHDNSLDVKPQTQTTHVQPTQINSVDSVKYKFGFKATSDTSQTWVIMINGEPLGQRDPVIGTSFTEVEPQFSIKTGQTIVFSAFSTNKAGDNVSNPFTVTITMYDSTATNVLYTETKNSSNGSITFTAR